ncbi:hypothetical protein KFK09_023750 [Dendrobium nobile]|uniref:Uncharacterized protein n=1 Tax=Dendrobium nobile TaxID=94219 RepID=A0A8T3ABX0_DENNO|nr:hypothetical protein KFK09_023741 [Dendrobium nobile]KAI0493629.1 hypothetical protein KFK09_023750 [Dendrobium nobile]
MEEGKKPLSRSREEGAEEKEDKGKKARYDRCLTGLDLKLDRPIRDLDPEKLKNEIRRWARVVARYARQLSRTFSGLSTSRRRSSSSSSRDDDASAAAVDTTGTSPSRK